MKIKLLFCVLGFLNFSGSANAQKTMPLYNGEIPNSNLCGDKEITDPNGRNVVRRVTRPTLTVFFPEKQNQSRVAVIVCPGGGYSNLSIQDGGYKAAEELAKSGIVSFVLKYRTVDTVCNSNYSIVPLQDVQQAIYQVKSNAKKWNIDTAKVGLLGFSAGGHLVATAATQYQHPQINAGAFSLRPAFTILAYPVISFSDALTSPTSSTRNNLVGINPTEMQKKWFSPEQNVTQNTPPAFLVHSSNDSTAYVENSIAYYQALHRYKIPAEMMIYQKGGHGFALYNKAEDDYWLPKLVKWLELNF
jgi:acetyl esterase/lipase